MLNNKKIAVLITNFNRKRLTKKCLLSLNLDKYKHDVYLLDESGTISQSKLSSGELQNKSELKFTSLINAENYKKSLNKR